MAEIAAKIIPSNQECRMQLFSLVRGGDAMAVPEMHGKMNAAVRNYGRRRIASSAIAAVDVALWA